MLRKPLNYVKEWFKPTSSFAEYKASADANFKPISFRYRLAGIYRAVTGRLDSPKTIKMIEGVPAEIPSRNHGGYYDLGTGGVLNAVESFFAGNWIQTERRRNLFKYFPTNLLIWGTLNLVRAAVGVVATAIAFIPAAIYHGATYKSNKAAATDALRAHVERMNAEAQQQRDNEAASLKQTSEKIAADKARQNETERAKSRGSLKPIPKVDIEVSPNGEPILDKLDHTPGLTKHSWFKITRTIRDNHASVTCQLRNTPSKKGKLSSVTIAPQDNTEARMIDTVGSKTLRQVPVNDLAAQLQAPAGDDEAVSFKIETAPSKSKSKLGTALTSFSSKVKEKVAGRKEVTAYIPTFPRNN